jgi:flagellar biosynthesis/type III secretory pathway chaperone
VAELTIQGLLQTMIKLIQVHVSLLELAQQKTNVLVLNQVDKLNQIVNKETSFMKQITSLDLQRIEDISILLLERGYKPNPNITVGDLIKLVVKADDKKLLSDAQKQLLGTIDQLREKNQLNQKLIEHSLAFIEYSMDLVMGPSDDGVTYQNPSHQQQGLKRNGMFDSRA